MKMMMMMMIKKSIQMVDIMYHFLNFTSFHVSRQQDILVTTHGKTAILIVST